MRGCGETVTRDKVTRDKWAERKYRVQGLKAKSSKIYNNLGVANSNRGNSIPAR